MRGLYLSPIDIYGIGQGLEGVETDTHRQHQVQEQAIGLATKEFGKGTDKEIVVLVCAEDSEIDDDIDYHHDFACARGLGTLYADAAEERTEGGEGDEDKKPPVPPTIEDITGNDNEQVLQQQLVHAAAERIVEHKPIEQEYYRQENGKLNGVEEHTYIYKNANIENSLWHYCFQHLNEAINFFKCFNVPFITYSKQPYI